MMFSVLFSVFVLALMFLAAKVAAGIIGERAENDGYREACDHVAFVLSQNKILV